MRPKRRPANGGEVVISTAYWHGVASPSPANHVRMQLPLMITIQDNGAGIPEDIKPHLFEPFVTSKPKGSGLGLALVAKIIGDHGGVIEFERRAEADGVPRDAADAFADGGKLVTTSTVLVADDDAGIRTVIGQALERAGYQVRVTGNAATLWRWISDGQGDVVITDVVMPDENGLDLIPRIRKIRPELRVIVMSAQSTLLTAVKATERGAFEYLPKPFDLNELIAVVRRALEAPEAGLPPQHAGRRRAARREVAADRPIAGDAGDLSDAGPADGHRPDGADQRRIRHRQGAGRARLARLRQTPLGAVRRHQHGGDPARTDRERAVRP